MQIVTFLLIFKKHCYVLAFLDAYQVEGCFFGRLNLRGFSIKLRSLKTEQLNRSVLHKGYFCNSQPGHNEDGVVEMPMVRCKPAAGRFPTPRVPGANMGDLYHIDADGLQAYPRCESWNCCQFSLHCHLTAGDTLFDIMKASFRSSLLSAYYNSVTESPWMLWNDLFQRFVYRGIFFQDHFQLQALQLLQSSTLHRSPHGPTLF